MQRICPTCGATLNEFEFIFKPMNAGEWKRELENIIPEGLNVSIEVVENERLRLEIHQDLTSIQKGKLKQLVLEKGYIELTKQEYALRGDR